MIDLIFPPFCKSCGERCFGKYLCKDCWQLCEMPDPATRCRHCFDDLDSRGTLCSQCRQKPKLSAVRAAVFNAESPAPSLGVEAVNAMASFAYLQWVQLEWSKPDAVIPIMGAKPLAKAFASLCTAPFVPALNSHCHYLEDCLDEEMSLLLIDISSPFELLQKATQSLSESFPKRIYILSIFTGSL